jgi:excisionase family DNA binding protein
VPQVQKSPDFLYTSVTLGLEGPTSQRRYPHFLKSAKKGEDVETLLRAEDVRERLDLRSVQTVYRWVKSGELPAVVIGKRVIRFREADVTAFIEAHAQGLQTT